MKHIILVLVILCGVYQIHAQEFTRKYLEELGDEALLSLYDTHDGDSLVLEKIALTYLDRAKQEKDTIKMARGYDRLARIFHPKKNIIYADSIISLTNKIDNITYPSQGYILKASESYKDGKVHKTVENYLIAYDLAIRNNDISQQVFVSDYLIFFKSIYGDKKEALKLQNDRNNLVFSKDYKEVLKRETRKGANLDIDSLHVYEKILSLQNYSICYMNLRELDSARFYAKEALQMVSSYNSIHSEGLKIWIHQILIEISYYDKKYKQVIKQANNLLNNDFVKKKSRILKDIYMFRGLSNNAIGNENIGIIDLKKADSIYSHIGFERVQPYDRILFESLLEYYTKFGDDERTIFYLNKLIKVDSILQKNYEFFEPEIIKSFDTPKLIREKERLISSLETKNKKIRNIGFWAWSLLLLSVLILIYYYNIQRKYRARFEALIAIPQTVNRDAISVKQTAEISAEIVEEILRKLKVFEDDKQFLNPNIHLQDLAKKMKTNSNYLSRIINLKREKNFAQYLHDLRIDYATQEISRNPNFRKYTVKAIAMECGYSNADSFSRAFYKKHGIYPSYYVKKLNRTSS